MEFVNVFEDSHGLYELCKAEGWTDAESYEAFYQNGGELSFFEGDPDMIKVNGNVGYFCKCRGKVWFYYDDFDGSAEAILQKFFDTYRTGITLGGEGYASGINPEGVEDVSGGWDAWEKIDTGIAFRGGGGYSYWITDWSEWQRKNLRTENFAA